jgi:hypothetical protein
MYWLLNFHPYPTFVYFSKCPLNNINFLFSNPLETHGYLSLPRSYTSLLSPILPQQTPLEQEEGRRHWWM